MRVRCGCDLVFVDIKQRYEIVIPAASYRVLDGFDEGGFPVMIWAL
jgi:hypothetical protein